MFGVAVSVLWPPPGSRMQGAAQAAQLAKQAAAPASLARAGVFGLSHAVAALAWRPKTFGLVQAHICSHTWSR